MTEDIEFERNSDGTYTVYADPDTAAFWAAYMIDYNLTSFGDAVLHLGKRLGYKLPEQTTTVHQ